MKKKRNNKKFKYLQRFHYPIILKGDGGLTYLNDEYRRDMCIVCVDMACVR